MLTRQVNKDFKTNISIQKVNLSVIGNVDLQGVTVLDHHRDSLIHIAKLSTSVTELKKMIANNFEFSDIRLKGVSLKMKTYRYETQDNLSVFINSFEEQNDTTSTSSSFKLSSKNIYLEDFRYRFIDSNKKDSIQFSANNGGGSIQDFNILGSKVKMNIRGLYFEDNRGIKVKNLTTNFMYSKTRMQLLNTTIATQSYSKVKGDIIFKYKIEDLSDFVEKVNISAKFKRSKLSLIDLNKFYGELRGRDMLHFSGSMKGTLNNFGLKKFHTYSKEGLQIKGDFGFVNSFNVDRGFLFDGKIQKVVSNYQQLKRILPNVLGNIMPSDIQKIGNFELSGLLRVTPDQMDATLSIDSKVGKAITDLQLTDISNIDKAKYSGEIQLEDLDLAELTNDTKFGKLSLSADVNGQGFKVNHISTMLIGEVQKIDFKGYSYKNIKVNGVFENSKFDGFLSSEDDNFKLNFEGLADFSSATHKFNFKTDIQNIDLKKTNLYTRDSTSIVQGKIKLNITGNNFNDIVGKAVFKDVAYQNHQKKFKFENFMVESSVTDSIQTVKVTSKDIVNGKLKGRFLYKELIPIAQNALWSTYSNYDPVVVKPNQFINFDFEIYNQIVALLYPDVQLAKNTKLKGSIDGNSNKIKLLLESPKINYLDSSLDSIEMRVDNKNKLYNTYVKSKKITTNYYNIYDLNLINRTKNDSLFFKSTFKGGEHQDEKFGLDFFYTYNSDKNSVLGFQKSKINFNNTTWNIDSYTKNSNLIIYNSRLKNIDVKPLIFKADKRQKITVKGFVNRENKDLAIALANVNLPSIIPNYDFLKLQGIVNANINIIEKDGVVHPQAKVKIQDLIVNDFSQGTVKAEVKGDKSYKKLGVKLSVRDYNFDNVKAKGILDFSLKKPLIDMDFKFDKYELNGFSDFFGDALSNIRGLLSGNFNVKGAIENPKFNGKLNLDKAGLTIPYLNIDFDFVKNSNITLKNNSFIFNELVLQDTKHDTKGFLSGSVYHHKFEDWFLDLNINSDNLLILDTKEVDDIPYYGKGFLEGSASLKGKTDDLTIAVRGKTQKNTLFVIPLSDVATVNSYKLIHFKEKSSDGAVLTTLGKVSGLKLNINLEVTKDAVAQIVIDKINKSELKGSGTGQLQINIDTQGDFTMEGGLVIDKGVYNFRYTGIPKKFAVQRGGTISWSGDPYAAELDLVALYQARANPAQFIDNISSSRKIPVNLYAKITGGLFDSKQEFDIKIPNADYNVASELEFRFENDNNSKMLNFASLLLGNTFYNTESNTDFASNIATSTASDVLSNVLSNMINTDEGKIKFKVGYSQADNSNIETGILYDDQVDVSVQSQISDRVIFNGKVGVPVGTKSDFQSGIVGEAKLEVLLNDEGTLRWNIFNRPNDIQYLQEEQGYTQGTGFSYQVNFNSLRGLTKKINFIKKDTLKAKSKLSKKDKTSINAINKLKDSTKYNEYQKN